MDISNIIKPIDVGGKIVIPLIEIANNVKEDNWRVLECDYFRLINEKENYLFEYGDSGFELTPLKYNYESSPSFKAWRFYDYLDSIGIDYRI